ncbi:MAG: acetyltransferase [Thalassobius sp.]|nr:acetyltransferase [Thalassovita sp.]
MLRKLRVVLGEFKLYINNYIINHIPSHTIRLLYYRNIMCFEIGENSYIHMGCVFNSPGKLKIGNNSVINRDCKFDTRGTITIGNNVSISEGTYFWTSDHDPLSINFKGRVKPIIIDDYVYIGASAMVLLGCHLYKGSVLGARSLLTKPIPEFEIWAGVPALKIGDRNKNLTYTIRYKRLFQ